MRFKAMGDPTQPGFTLENAPFYLMAHADHQYHEDMEIVLRRHGIDRSIYRVLSVLREGEPASISRIADIALLKRPTVSRIVERMGEKRLVETAARAEDNRVTEVSLTDRGRDVMAILTPIVARQVARALDGIDDADVGTLIRTLQAIIANLNRLGIE